MFQPEPLPRTLFEEIGKIVVLWATIEQDILLQTSALAAQETDGKTTDFLRLEFKRLRQEWLKLCRKHFSTHTINTIALPLNQELARLSDQRGLIVHGRWKPKGRGKFELDLFEQKSQLTRFQTD